MQNSTSISKIMEELGLDPNDTAAKAIIEQLITAQPNVEMNEQFISDLRTKLADRAGSLASKPKQSINIISIFMKRTIVSAVVLLVVIAGGAWLLQKGVNPDSRNQDSLNELLSSKYAVTDVAANSFGELTTENLSSDRGSGIGGGNEVKTPETTTSEAPADQKMIAPTGGDPSQIDYVPYPAPETYTFAYKGEPLENLAARESVYKRTKPRQPASLVERIVDTLSLGLVDLGKFRDAQVESFSLVEDREMGYSVNVLLTMGTVSIYQNWYTWPQPYANCRDEACWQQSRVTIDQIPSDEEAISIANAFLDEYGVSRAGYGRPVIQFDQWRLEYERAIDKSMIYLPEQVQVTYPLVLDGKTVYDEGGNYYGLNVTVDARSRKVASAYEIGTRQFEKSSYDAETDSKRIIGVAERGGFRNYLYDDPNAKKVTLELGTPTRQMINMWYNTDPSKPGDPIYVPALVFPITNFDQSHYWRKNVIVPLVKEILDSDNQYPITIMGGGGAAESAPAQSEPALPPADKPVTNKPQ